MIRKGRRWFRVKHQPVQREGHVMWLRSPKHDTTGPRIQVQVTVEMVTPDEQGCRVWFLMGDRRPEVRYIAAGWPDYTSDPFRAMPDEFPPVPETEQERKERAQWLLFGMS